MVPDYLTCGLLYEEKRFITLTPKDENVFCHDDRVEEHQNV